MNWYRSFRQPIAIAGSTFAGCCALSAFARFTISQSDRGSTARHLAELRESYPATVRTSSSSGVNLAWVTEPALHGGYLRGVADFLGGG